MRDAPCDPWPLDTSCWTTPDDVDPYVVERAQRIATDILWALSGRRWGLCTVTVRPCLRSCTGMSSGLVAGTLVPYTVGGRWYNASLCGCGSDCACTSLCEVRLDPSFHDVVEVRVDGDVVPSTSYRVDAPALLLRTDGMCWPSCQDMTAADDEYGAFAVTYRMGVEPTDAAIAAVSELAEELVKSCTPGCDCELPRQMTQRAMQGITTEYITPDEFIGENGRTGLYLVDLWLSTVNPDRLSGPSRVISPDMPTTRRTVWTP